MVQLQLNLFPNKKGELEINIQNKWRKENATPKACFFENQTASNSFFLMQIKKEKEKNI